MKKKILLLFLYFISILIFSQQIYRSPESYFKSASALYLENKKDLALKELSRALSRYPSDKKLQNLYQEIVMREALQNEMEKQNKRRKSEQEDKKGESKQKPNAQGENTNRGAENKNNDVPPSDKDGGQNAGGQRSGSKNSDKGASSSEGEINKTGTQELDADIILDALAEQEKQTKKKTIISNSRKNTGAIGKDW